MSCGPPLVGTARYVCAPSDATNLCVGVKALLTLPCSELTDTEALETVLARIGLKPHRGGAMLYGARGARNMAMRNGMSQHPMQLAPALVRLSTLQLRSYLEVGVDAGWTLTVATAFLKRFGLTEAVGVDITFDRISASTRQMLKRLEVTLVKRNVLSSRPMDLCFIDASHALQDLVVDFHDMQPRCKHLMFHDVSDFDCWRNAAGGPAKFWSVLKSHVARSRWTEFVMQPDLYPPTFGIGLLFSGTPVTLNESALRAGAEPAGARGIARKSLKVCLGGGG